MRLPSECGVRIIKRNYNFYGPYPKPIPSDMTSYTQSSIEHPGDPLCIQHLKHLTKLGIDIDEVSTGYLGNIGCLLMWLYKRTPTLFEISGSVIHRMQRQHTDLHQLTVLHHPKALCDVRDVNLMYRT